MKHLKIVWNKKWKILGWTVLGISIVFDIRFIVTLVLIGYFIRLAIRISDEINEERELRIKRVRWEAMREVNKFSELNFERRGPASD